MRGCGSRGGAHGGEDGRDALEEGGRKSVCPLATILSWSRTGPAPHTPTHTVAPLPAQVAVTMWVSGEALGLPAVAAAMVALSALLLTGVLTWKGCLEHSSAWDTLVWWVQAQGGRGGGEGYAYLVGAGAGEGRYAYWWGLMWGRWLCSSRAHPRGLPACLPAHLGGACTAALCLAGSGRGTCACHPPSNTLNCSLLQVLGAHGHVQRACQGGCRDGLCSGGSVSHGVGTGVYTAHVSISGIGRA